MRPRDQERLPGDIGVRGDEVVREPDIKWLDTFKARNLLVGELDAQRLYVVHKVLDLAPADDGEDVGCFGHDICQRDGRHRLDAVLRGHLGQGLADSGLVLGLVARLSSKGTQALAGALAILELGFALELASAEDGPSVLGRGKLAYSRRLTDKQDEGGLVTYGASAIPKWRAMGMISRSKSRSNTFHRPW